MLLRIGAACARDLAKHGVHLALTYSKNLDGIATLVSEIYESSAEAAKLRISIHKVDVGVVDEISNLFKEIQEQHRTHVDILVSNAGYGKRIVDVWFVDPRDFERATDLRQGYPTGGVSIHIERESNSFFLVGERSC